MKKITLSILALMAISTSAMAERQGLEKIFTECGLGAMIFPTIPAAAAISNIIWDLGTTATSSEISSKESCKGGKAQVAMLIGNTYDQLETEIAEGKGKYVDTLSTLSGKSVLNIRSEFSTVVASDDSTNMSKMEKAEKLFSIATR